jgi:excisionase family DNA binding protein
MDLDTARQRATISVTEAGELLGLARGSAYAAANRGEIPTRRFGRRLLVPVAALLALLGETADAE